MVRVLLESPFAAFFLTCLPGSIGAQCAPEWPAGTPLAHVRGNVRVTTTWDPDGAGPLPVCLVVGGRFDVGLGSGSVALWTGAEWLPANPPVASTVQVATVWNGKLVVGSASGWIGAYDGTSWTELGTAESGGLGSPQPADLRAMLVYNGELILIGDFTQIWSSTNLWQVGKCARFDGTNWNNVGTGLPPGGARCAAVFNNSLFVGGYFDPISYPFPPIGPTPNLQVWNGTAWTSSGTWDGRIDTLAARIGTALTNSFLFAGGVFTQVNGTVSTPLVARFSPSTNSWTGVGSPATSSAPTGCTQLFVRATGLNSFETAAVFDVPTTDKVWRLSSGTWSVLGQLDDSASTGIQPKVGFFASQYVVGIRTVVSDPPLPAVRAFDAASGTWVPIVGPGFTDAVLALCTDGTETIVAGRFTTYGGIAINRIARGHDDQWQPLGSGLTGGEVAALVRMPNGDIVAGGDFTDAGGAPASRIARWNGSSWSPLGSGMNGRVAALLVMPSGDLVAGGAFTTAGGTVANRVARWNGSSWSSLGTGTDGDVLALALHPNGDVIAAGAFTTAGGGGASRVARWNGSSWSPLGAGVDATAMAAAVTPSGDVWIGGAFQTAGGGNARHIARWDGTQWSSGPSQSQPSTPVDAVAALPNNEVAIGRGETSGNTCFARLRGGAWDWAVRGSSVRAIALRDDGRIVVGGDFTSAGAFAAGNVATLAPTCPAIVVVHGSGCTGSGGANVLAPASLPWDGAVFRSHTTGLAPATVTLNLFGFVQTLVQLSLLLPEALPGCLLSTTPDIVTLGLPTGGSLDTEIFIAPSPSLVGVTIYHQVLPFEFGTAGQVSAITATNALALTIGSL